jgi:hypothetical protein
MPIVPAPADHARWLGDGPDPVVVLGPVDEGEIDYTQIRSAGDGRIARDLAQYTKLEGVGVGRSARHGVWWRDAAGCGAPCLLARRCARPLDACFLARMQISPAGEMLQIGGRLRLCARL